MPFRPFSAADCKVSDRPTARIEKEKKEEGGTRSCLNGKELLTRRPKVWNEFAAFAVNTSLFNDLVFWLAYGHAARSFFPPAGR